jgi:hypothetical protein
MNSLHHLFVTALFLSSNVFAADWPTWGGDATRNMVSLETGLNFDFEPGEMNDDESVKMETTKNIKWVAKL